MEAYVWATFFSGLVSIRMHPRNEAEIVDLEELALVADRMYEIYMRRFPCPTLPAQ